MFYAERSESDSRRLRRDHAVPYLQKCRGGDGVLQEGVRCEEILRMGEGEVVGHAEMKIGNAIFMMADEFPDMGAVSPQSLGGTPVSLYIYVEDVDGFTEHAIAEGLKVLKPVSDQFYGDRSGHFEDPFGHHWGFATHREDLTPEELNERMKKAG